MSHHVRCQSTSRQTSGIAEQRCDECEQHADRDSLDGAVQQHDGPEKHEHEAEARDALDDGRDEAAVQARTRVTVRGTRPGAR